ncbi:hypothetical protein M514_27955, partial [Trichuris suis]
MNENALYEQAFYEDCLPWIQYRSSSLSDGIAAIVKNGFGVLLSSGWRYSGLHKLTALSIIPERIPRITERGWCDEKW